MEGKKRRYFDRDISWLAFNKRVLQESLDKSVPIYERISFLSIFSSNLEEFYQVRVASNRMALERAIKKGDKDEVRLKRESFKALTDEVKSQEELFRQAWEEVMVPDLFEAGVKVFTHAEEFTGKIRAFVERYFEEEVFPYLSAGAGEPQPYECLCTRQANLPCRLCATPFG